MCVWTSDSLWYESVKYFISKGEVANLSRSLTNLEIYNRKKVIFWAPVLLFFCANYLIHVVIILDAFCMSIYLQIKAQTAMLSLCEAILKIKRQKGRKKQFDANSNKIWNCTCSSQYQDECQKILKYHCAIRILHIHFCL